MPISDAGFSLLDSFSSPPPGRTLFYRYFIASSPLCQSRQQAPLVAWELIASK
jgi:hypothetical protein